MEKTKHIQIVCYFPFHRDKTRWLLCVHVYEYVQVDRINTVEHGGWLTFSTAGEYGHHLLSGTWCWFSRQPHLYRPELWTMSPGNYCYPMTSQIGEGCARCLGFPFAWPVTFPEFVLIFINMKSDRGGTRTLSCVYIPYSNIATWSTLTICCILLANKGLADTLWNDVAAFGPWNAWNAGGWFVGNTWYGEPCSGYVGRHKKTIVGRIWLCWRS